MQEKAPSEAFSVIVIIDGSFATLYLTLPGITTSAWSRSLPSPGITLTPSVTAVKRAPPSVR